MPIDNFTLDQHTAVELCTDISERIVSVTGEAGTGKTFVLGEAVSALKDRGRIVALAAPTGRAAARIREATGHDAKTIHRLLGYGFPDPDDPDDTTIPERSKRNPIPADDIFIDESSMLSEDLYRNLINAMMPRATVRFFGDINQLPPVLSTQEPPFRRLLDKFPKVILTKNFRSTDGIIQAAQSIIRGKIPITNKQFRLLKLPNQIGLSVIDKFIDADMFDPTLSQIISPTHVGKLGCVIINSYVQEKINPGKRALEYQFEHNFEVEKRKFRPGDKILWTKNDYYIGLMNGMIGRFLDFDELSGDCAVEFEGKDYTIPSNLSGYDSAKKKSYDYDPRKYMDLAYAITTHKSQGSEFQRVLLILNWSGVMTRQNFYTAVTRGRQQVTVLAGPGGLKAAMKNDPSLERKK